MPFRLSGLQLNRVDLVPDGANPDAHIVLFKNKEGRVPAKTKKKAAAKSKAKVDSRSKSKQRGDEDEDEEEDDDAVTKSQDDEDDDDEENEDDDEETDDEDGEDEKPTKKSKSKGKAKKSSAKKADKKKPAKKVKKASKEEDDDTEDDDADDDDEDDDDVKKSSDDDEDEEDEDDNEDEEDGLDADVLKSLPGHVRKALKEQSRELKTLRKETREATKIAKEERDRRTSLEFVEKAKEMVPTLPGTAEEKGSVLKAIAGIPVETVRKSLRRMLKAGDAAMKSMLAETGRTRADDEDDDSALSQLREKGDEIMKASKGVLSKEQAFEKACQNNPALFTSYRVEKRRERSRIN